MLKISHTWKISRQNFRVTATEVETSFCFHCHYIKMKTTCQHPTADWTMQIMPSTLLKKRVEKFQKQYQNHQNTVCQIVNNFKP